jgi:hypothetical protein
VVLVNNDENGGFEKLDVVKRYFHRIFTVLSKEVRDKLMELDLPKDELKEVKKELAFLSEDQQLDFLDELATENK